MRKASKIFIVVVIGLFVIFCEYFQVIKYSLIQQQLRIIAINQQKILGQLKIMEMLGNGGLAKLQPKEDFIDYNKEYQINIGNSSIKGNKDAKVTIVEFSDFQCPFSQMFHPVAEKVLEAYPEEVRLVFKNFPLAYHSLARPAIKATFAAREQGKYWEMVGAIFQEGKTLSEPKLQELAKKIGLDIKKFNQDIKEKDTQWEKLIEEDIAAAEKAEVKGTPTFFINGKFMQGRGLEDFKATVDKILQGDSKKK